MPIVSACIVCGSAQWLPLPNPQALRSISSDLRVLDLPLDKHACTTCGLVRRRSSAGSALFESGYQLYDHAPGAQRESARQHAYATWLGSRIGRPPRSVLDLGCGNGSLLLALRRQWPEAELRGLDPSPESIARAREAGIDARCGSVGAVHLEPADLVVSVNVVEHVEDPVSFIRSMAALVSPGGSALLVCPDGGRIWLELLFADHLWSFAGSHLARLAAAAGLAVVGWAEAPPALGSFQLLQLSRAGAAESVVLASKGAIDVTRAKQQYLEAWRSLDQHLIALSKDVPSLACFGIGEAAALIRAYAPETWRRVKVCAVDNPEQRRFGEIPVIDYTGGRLEWPVLVAVRPDAQGTVAERLRAAGCSVIRWDDHIGA
jgi:SAM-dependent methyltransferase